MSKNCSSLQQRDRRHLLCSLITLLSVLVGFLFPNSLPRLAEAFWDLGTSIAYYFCKLLFQDANPISPTINTLPSWQFAPELWQRISILPETWEEFLNYWGTFLSLLFDQYNFLFYWYAVTDFLFYASRILLLLMPAFASVILILSKSKSKICTERGKKSKPLIIFEGFLFRYVYPAVAWCKSFRQFLKDNPGYIRSWLVIWALHFNFFSIGVSLIGYYFYLVSSWDLLSIYTQLLKLQRDVAPVVRFVPGLLWLAFFWWIYSYVCSTVAFRYLDAAEKANRNVIEQSAIITCVSGEPGLGKTQLITSMALTAQVKLFDDAFDIMLTRAAQFPNFPWQDFRDHLKWLVDRRIICDINQAKRYIARRKTGYDYLTECLSFRQLRRTLRKHPEAWYYFYGYDYIHYRSTYNDELKIIHLYDALESYAAAFLVFSLQSNLLFSNYSIRTDSILKDKGNLPLRNNDFFDRDPEMQEVYSQHAHIIDFDVLRLGRKIKENNEKANGAPVGVIVVSEIDKEFKNMQLLKETKINADETNQKNDLHDAALMMIRHGVVIDYKPFVCVLADLQRPEAWGAGGRELGNVMFIADKSAMQPMLPFYSSYWFTEGIFSWVKKKWNKYYADYQYRRSDETLMVFLLRNVMTAIGNHYERINGLFGMKVLLVEIQSGRLDGNIRKDKWRILAKKDYSKRYRTDCLQSVFDKVKPNTMHIDDFQQYAGELASRRECELQNSYFQNDVHKMKSNNKE